LFLPLSDLTKLELSSPNQSKQWQHNMPVNRFVISHETREQMLQSIFIIIPMWFLLSP
jgi:hypothetical protein